MVIRKTKEKRQNIKGFFLDALLLEFSGYVPGYSCSLLKFLLLPTVCDGY